MAKRLLPCLAVAALFSSPAGASDDPTRRAFNADPFQPALSLDGGFTVDTAPPAPQGAWRAGAQLDLTSGLLTLKQGAQTDDLLESRLALHLLGGYSAGPFEISVHLPLVLDQQSDLSGLTDQGVTGPLVAPIAGHALGDLRLGAKVPLAFSFMERWPISLAALADLRFPTGNPQAFSSQGLALATSLVATRVQGRVRLDGQVGWLAHAAGQYAQLVVPSAFTWGAGATLDLPPLKQLQRWKALLELSGQVPKGFESGSARYRAPAEVRTGLRAFLTQGFSVEAGLGTGLGEVGYGHERWRVFAGVRWSGQRAGGPEDDDDHDGVPNGKDACPTVPGLPQFDGCPDTDGDGIPDGEDRCPTVPGPAENEGCPYPEGEPLVEVESSRLSLKDSIHFDTDRDTIQPASFPVLDQVARILGEHGELQHLRIEGHTDNVGPAAYNKELSARRAASVVRYLVAKGVAADRLVAAGYGFERPIATNDTALGRAKNRRVEFTILDDGAVPAGKTAPLQR
jgi:outer membrane protein OmpA-like peptidoglycan-associated protein